MPAGYERISIEDASFAAYLRNLSLLPDGAPVKYYDGSEKRNNEIYTAVAAIDIGFEDLQRASEICIRLRGEYLFESQQYRKIAFTISTHERISYVNWVEGLKITIEGKPYWTKSPTEADRYRTFRRYLEFIYTYAHIETLLDDVQRASLYDIQPGDMFIQATRPGHVVMVVDVAESRETGDRIFLLAQSYKPAQSFHVLLNPGDANLSPWYSISAIDDKITTPEFIFYKRDLRRFRDIPETPSRKKGPTFYF
jgi:hypothetical protein